MINEEDAEVLRPVVSSQEEETKSSCLLCEMQEEGKIREIPAILSKIHRQPAVQTAFVGVYFTRHHV